MTPDAKAGEIGGLRYLAVNLPCPPADKNEVTASYCPVCVAKRKGQPEPSKKHVQHFPSDDAKLQRRLVVETVQPALMAAGMSYKETWFRPGMKWAGFLLQHFTGKYDADHYSVHLVDSLVHAKLASSDVDCTGVWPLKMAPHESDSLYLYVAEYWS